MKRFPVPFIVTLAVCAVIIYLWKNLPREASPRDLEMSVHYAVNEERRKHGLPDLIWREDIAHVARLHSRNMGARGFFSHDDPIEGGFAKRFSSNGVRDWSRCGENILQESVYYNPVREAVQGWMNSPGHRANILNRFFTHTGIGVAFGRDRLLYFTQEFMQQK